MVFLSERISQFKKRIITMCLKSGVPNYLSHEARNMLGPIH
jgi:hypothetical protein